MSMVADLDPMFGAEFSPDGKETANSFDFGPVILGRIELVVAQFQQADTGVPHGCHQRLRCGVVR